VGILSGGQAYVDCLVAYLGILRAGAVMVPFNPRFTETELKAALTLTECALLIADVDQGPRRQGCGESLPSVGRVAGCVPPHEDGEGKEGPERGGSEAPVTLPPVARDDVAKIVFTSGTPAMPKGVVHSHRTALATGL